MDAPETQTDAGWDYLHDMTAIDVTAEMVQRLIAEQFPDFAAMPIELIGPWGTDNAMFRVGDEFVARLPRSAWAKDAVAKEVRWLPTIVPHLPLRVPEVIGAGSPNGDYPWSWAVYRWIPGERPAISTLLGSRVWSEQIAVFLTALSEISNPEGPAPGPHNGFRGGPFAARDRWVRPVILEGPHPFDRDELLQFWQYAMELEAPSAGHRWLHGDLTPFNLLAEAGQITAVIDWGALAVGDPACDLMIAWNFDEPARTTLRDQLAVDDATWERGRAAAFWHWISGATTDPDNETTRLIDRVLTDYRNNR